MLSFCTKAQLTDLAARMTRRQYEKGDDLMVEGSEGHEFFIIVKGSCSVLVGKASIATLSVGDFCGEQALLSLNARAATVRADTSVLALVVTDLVFRELIHKDFEITFAKREAICADEDRPGYHDDVSNENASASVDRTKSPTELKWIWYSLVFSILSLLYYFVDYSTLRYS